MLQDLLVLLEFHRARVVDVGYRLREFLLGTVYRGMKFFDGGLESGIGSLATGARGEEGGDLRPRWLVLHDGIPIGLFLSLPAAVVVVIARVCAVLIAGISRHPTIAERRMKHPSRLLGLRHPQ